MNIIGSFKCCTLKNAIIECLGLKIQIQNFPNSINTIKDIIKEINLNQINNNDDKKLSNIIFIDQKTSNESNRNTFGEWSNFTGGHIVKKNNRNNFETEFMPFKWIKNNLNTKTEKLFNSNSLEIIADVNKNFNNSNKFNLETPTVLSTNKTMDSFKFNLSLISELLNKNNSFNFLKKINSIDNIFPNKSDSLITNKNNTDVTSTKIPFDLKISIGDINFDNNKKYSNTTSTLINEEKKTENIKKSNNTNKDSNDAALLNKLNLELKKNLNQHKEIEQYDSNEEMGLEISFRKNLLFTSGETNTVKTITTSKKIGITFNETDTKQVTKNNDDKLIYTTKSIKIELKKKNKSDIDLLSSTYSTTLNTSTFLTKKDSSAELKTILKNKENFNKNESTSLTASNYNVSKIKSNLNLINKKISATATQTTITSNNATTPRINKLQNSFKTTPLKETSNKNIKMTTIKIINKKIEEPIIPYLQSTSNTKVNNSTTLSSNSITKLKKENFLNIQTSQSNKLLTTTKKPYNIKDEFLELNKNQTNLNLTMLRKSNKSIIQKTFDNSTTFYLATTASYNIFKNLTTAILGGNTKGIKI